MFEVGRNVARCVIASLTCMAGSLFFCSATESELAADQELNLLINPGFESGSPGEVPIGWYAGEWNTVVDPSYSVEITDENVLIGSGAALIRNTRLVDFSEPAIGNLAQRIDASALQGHRLRLSASIRKEMPEDSFGAAILAIEAERAGDQSGTLSVLSELPTDPLSAEWDRYTITVDLESDVIAVHVGVHLYGNAQIWIDDVSLIDLGEPIPLAEPARALGDHGLENLIAFTRLLGYIRHFHAGDEACSCDWDEFAVKAINTVEEATDPTDLASRLETLFKPVAPTLQVYPTAEEKLVTLKDWWPEPLGADWSVISYRHKGCGQLSQMPSVYHTERVTKPVDDSSYAGTALDPCNPFQANIGGGVSCAIPLAVFADAEGTLPRAPAPPFDPTTGRLKYSGNDRSCRLAGVALAWNVMQHFYPYFDVVDIDWSAGLRAALTSAAEDPDELAFLYTLRRMMAALQDGHGRVYHNCSEDKFQIPVVLGWADDLLVITEIGSGDTGGLQPGDLVLRINGADVDQAVQRAEETAAAGTPQRHRLIVSRSLVQGAENAEITLEVLSPEGEPRSATLRCEVPVGELTEHRPPSFSEIEPGIFYIGLERGKENDIEALLPKLEKAKGIVIDSRGIPGVGVEFLRHLTAEPMLSARFKVPIFTEPDQQNITEYDESGRWNVEPAAPQLQAKLAFIIDASTQSYLECIIEFVDAYELGELVGEPTSGANGNVNPFILPGDYEVQWTGMIVLKNDGSQHHAVGIQPTVPVSRTIRGVAEGWDEMLERALAIVSE